MQRHICALLHSSRCQPFHLSPRTRPLASHSPAFAPPPFLPSHAAPYLATCQLRMLLCLASHARFMCRALRRSCPSARAFDPAAAVERRLSSGAVAEVLVKAFAPAVGAHVARKRRQPEP